MSDRQLLEEAAPQLTNWAQAELDAAKASPDGAWLSPEAQALYEAEGAARFAKFHRVRAAAAMGSAQSAVPALDRKEA